MSKKALLFTLGVATVALVTVVVGYQLNWLPLAGPLGGGGSTEIPTSECSNVTVGSDGSFNGSFSTTNTVAGETYTVTATQGGISTSTNVNIVATCTADAAITQACFCSRDREAKSSGYCCYSGWAADLNGCNYGSISGQVIDQSTQLPIAGATVGWKAGAVRAEIESENKFSLISVAHAAESGAGYTATTTTDVNGNFTFAHVTSGSVNLTITATNYTTSTASVTVTSGQTATTLVQLTTGGACSADAACDKSCGAGKGYSNGDGKCYSDGVCTKACAKAELPLSWLGSLRNKIFAPALAGPTGSISGTVTNSSTGLPVQGASISLNPAQAISCSVTDETGAYSCSSVVADPTITITVSMNGYESSLAPIVVNAGQNTVYNASLTPLTTGSISGTITNKNTGSPLPGATITLNPVQAEACSTSDKFGIFSCSTVSAGTVTITVSKDGYESTASGELLITAGQNTVYDASLSPIGSISGNIKDSSTELPIEGATVTLDPVQQTACTASDVNGNYSCPSVADGNVTYTASANGYTSETRSVIMAGQALVADFSLVSSGGGSGTITGTVVDSQGSRVDGVTVTAGVGVDAVSAATANGGRFSISINAGTYDVTAGKSGYGNTTTQNNVVVTSGQATALGNLSLTTGAITLSPITAIASGSGLSVAGTSNLLSGSQVCLTVAKLEVPVDYTISGKATSVDTGGAPAVGVAVQALQGQTVINSTTTDSSGNYSLTVTAGDYKISATGGGYDAYTSSLLTIGENTVHNINMSLPSYGLPKTTCVTPAYTTTAIDGKTDTGFWFKVATSAELGNKYYVVPNKYEAKVTLDGLEAKTQLTVDPAPVAWLDKLKKYVDFSKFFDVQNVFAADSPNSVQMGSITINIKDKTTGDMLMGKIAISNTNIGEIRMPIAKSLTLDYFPIGTYTVTADSFGYTSSSQSITIATGTPATATFELEGSPVIEDYLRMIPFQTVTQGNSVIIRGNTNVDLTGKTLCLTIYALPPKISIVQPLSTRFWNPDLAGDIKVKLAIESANNISQIGFRPEETVDWSPSDSFTEGTNVNQEIDLKAQMMLMDEGFQKIYFKAQDSSGGLSDLTETYIETIIDKRPPKPLDDRNYFQFKRPTDVDFNDQEDAPQARIPIGEIVKLKANVADDTSAVGGDEDQVSGVASVKFEVDNTQVCYYTGVDVTKECEWDTTDLHSTVTITVCDEAGNCTEEEQEVPTYASGGRVATDTTAPGDVGSATVTDPAPATGTSLKVSWTNPSDADYGNMDIYRSTALGTLGSLIASNVSGTSYLDVDLTTGTAYYYTLRPKDTTGNINSNTIQYSGTPSAPAAATVPTTMTTETQTSETGEPVLTLELVLERIVGLSGLYLELNSPALVGARVESIETNKPSEIADIATTADVVYKYFNISLENLDENQIKDMTLEFAVAKDWMSANGIDVSGLAFYHFVYHSPGNWEEITATRSGEDMKNYYFKGWTSQLAGLYTIIGRPSSAPAIVKSLGQIGGVIFEDLNVDGKFDNGELGISGTKVRLYADTDGDTNLNLNKDQFLATQVVGVDGRFRFENLEKAGYIVFVDRTSLPATYGLTTNNEPLHVTLGEGEQMVNFKIGYNMPLAGAAVTQPSIEEITSNIFITRKARIVAPVMRPTFKPFAEAVQNAKVTQAIIWALIMVVIMVFLVWRLTKKPA